MEHKRVIGTAMEADQAMPMRAVMTMPPSWMVDGYLGAVERVRAAVAADEDTARGISIAVAEALMWLDAQREIARDVGRGRDKAAELYRDPIVRALGFARGRVHHHWAPVASKYDGVAWGWLSADNFPLPPEARFADPEGERLYKEHLEHRPVLDALEVVARRLEGVERP